ncbi:MAG TPA: sigma-70 family RNA polymerase sigma factor [Terriglobales bacterium]|nr:sigma-70 family RNA polymerase sigma factor [Terriglobales bacterium]
MPEKALPLATPAPPADLDTRFTALVVRHRASLYRTALRQLGNPADAEDALQDALLLAYRHLDKFEGRSAIGTWLTRIVINAARGQRRRALVRPASSLEVVVAAGRQFPDSCPGPEARLYAREQQLALARLLARLSPPLRVAVESCDLANLPLPQAAQRLGIKPATLHARLHRAHHRLAALRACEPRSWASGELDDGPALKTRR